MKVIRLADPGRKPLLVAAEAPQPRPGDGEVLIRVRAAGVTAAELEWYPTSHSKTGATRRGAVPCHEFSGEIAEVGAGVVDFSVGRAIYGMSDWYADGALAEYCIAEPDQIAAKPEHLDFVEAASVPIGALTAWQGLFDWAHLQSGERVLIHGGAGAVGIFAIQLAHSHGAHVITTVSARNADFVKQLGADEAIDYKAAPFEQQVREIDVVFDAVGGDTLRRSWSVLKSNGRLITIASGSEMTADEREKRAFFIVEPNRAQLVEVARMLDAGELRTVVDTRVAFSEASKAFEGTVERTRRGKLVVTVA